MCVCVHMCVHNCVCVCVCVCVCGAKVVVLCKLCRQHEVKSAFLNAFYFQFSETLCVDPAICGRHSNGFCLFVRGLPHDLCSHGNVLESGNVLSGS